MAKGTSSNDLTASSATENKLVSVICRTIGRNELSQALASVANQSYSRVELILVDALGSGIDDIESLCANRSVKLVTQGKKLSRPEAANAGITAASGDYLMLLDEDDWIATTHIEKLVSLLDEQDVDNDKLCRAAFSNTQKASQSGQLLDHIFDRSFDAAFLKRDNFIPIHSMLFAASLVEQGCRFDEALDIYEDWDFWLQVTQHTEVLHLDQVTAFYREGGSSETAVENEKNKYMKGHPSALAREKVIQKWLPHWTAADINQMLGTMDQSETITEIQRDLHASKVAILTDQHKQKLTNHSELTAKYEALSQSNQPLTERYRSLIAIQKQLAVDYDHLQANYHRLSNKYKELDQSKQGILGSWSWRVTKPLRHASRPFRHLARHVHQIFRRTVINSAEGTVGAGTSESANKNLIIADIGHSQNYPVDVTSIASRDPSERKFYYSLDVPSQSDMLFSDFLLIQGWALTEFSPVVIRVFIDRLEYCVIKPAIARADVAAIHPGILHADWCGFSERISLSFLDSGPHSLRLRVTDPGGFQTEIEQRFYVLKGNELYKSWLTAKLRKNQLSSSVENMRIRTNSIPIIHILLSADGDLDTTLRTLESVENQQWTHWKMHYLGDNWQKIEEWATNHEYTEFLKKSRPISKVSDLLCGAENVDLEHDFLLGLNAGELLLPHALFDLVECAISKNSIAVYSDHDSINETGDHLDPVFTFSWSPDHLMSRNYVGDVYLACLSKLPTEFLLNHQGPNWRYALLLELSVTTANTRGGIDRVAKILWSTAIGENDDSKETFENEIYEIEGFLTRNKLAASIKNENDIRHIEWHLDGEPSVTIVIPTMGKLNLIRPCLDSLAEITDYANYEVVLLDNSRGKFPDGINYLHEKGFTVIECNEAFNWARLNNIGAKQTESEFILFLNDDIEIIEGHWLRELVAQAARPDVGVVGGLLLYPNGAIQHAGVFIVNHGGGCAHIFHKMMPDASIYRRLDRTTREVTANTGACLMVSRAKFERLKGFDEELAVVGNDIDLCFRLQELGYRNIWSSSCKLIHHESISRSNTVPAEDEQTMWRRWGKKFEAGDRFYNPNLTLKKWDCSIHIDVSPEELISAANLESKSLPSSPSLQLQKGVNLIAYIRAEMGLGEAARSEARAMEAAAIDFGIINFESGNPSRMGDLSWQHKEALNAPYDINLIHINPDYLVLAKQELPTHFFEGRYNIGYWAWELEELPEDWFHAFDEIDEVWVPSNFVKSAVERYSHLPVVTIPHSIDLKSNNDFARDYFNIPNKCFVFLSMFDVHSVAERKNPYGAINAFKKAFKGDDKNVCLVLKVNNATDSTLTELRANIDSYKNILFLNQRLSRQEINSLYSLIDCYVSLHRSEGFGLGPAEAMSLGKATILTNWSGSTDYMTEENCVPIDYELIEIVEDLGPYKAGQRWAEPNIDQASNAMLKLVEDPELVRNIGENAQQFVKTFLSPEAVGIKIKQRIETIRKQL